jgi:hypothetical protein
MAAFHESEANYGIQIHLPEEFILRATRAFKALTMTSRNNLCFCCMSTHVQGVLKGAIQLGET